MNSRRECTRFVRVCACACGVRVRTPMRGARCAHLVRGGDEVVVQDGQLNSDSSDDDGLRGARISRR